MVITRKTTGGERGRMLGEGAVGRISCFIRNTAATSLNFHSVHMKDISVTPNLVPQFPPSSLGVGCGEANGRVTTKSPPNLYKGQGRCKTILGQK